MDISFIIINYNTRHYLEQCLASIEQHCNGITYEIIVVDNASKDDSVSFIKEKFPQIILVLNDTNQGFAKANNQAAIIAKGAYLFLLNADTVIVNDIIDKAIKYMKENGTSVLGPKLLNKDGTLQVSFQKANTLNQYILDVFSLAFPFKRLVQRLKTTPIESPTAPSSMGFLLGAALIIDTNVVKKNGLFDESYFFTGEERDFCLKMIQAKKNIIYFPELQIIHYGGSGNPHSTFQLFNWAQSSFILAKNHGSFFSIFLIKIVFSFFFINRAIIYFLKSFFLHYNNYEELSKKYFFLFLWSIGFLNEKKLFQ